MATGTELTKSEAVSRLRRVREALSEARKTGELSLPRAAERVIGLASVVTGAVVGGAAYAKWPSIKGTPLTPQNMAAVLLSIPAVAGLYGKVSTVGLEFLSGVIGGETGARVCDAVRARAKKPGK